MKPKEVGELVAMFLAVWLVCAVCKFFHLPWWLYLPASLLAGRYAR